LKILEILAIVERQTGNDKSQTSINTEVELESEHEKILCSHCQRTATNGLKCKGICVADNDY
jgi:hypothetical protein